MARIKCNGCDKEQLVVEKIRFCCFCSKEYDRHERGNAEQRMKQDRVVVRWGLRYGFCAVIFIFLILPAILPHVIPNPQTQGIAFWFAVVIWLGIMSEKPFARRHAKKLYPEKDPSA